MYSSWTFKVQDIGLLVPSEIVEFDGSLVGNEDERTVFEHHSLGKSSKYR